MDNPVAYKIIQLVAQGYSKVVATRMALDENEKAQNDLNRNAKAKPRV